MRKSTFVRLRTGAAGMSGVALVMVFAGALAAISLSAEAQVGHEDALTPCERAVSRAMANAVDTVTIDDNASDADVASASARLADNGMHARMRAMRAAAAQCIVNVHPSSLPATRLPDYATLQFKAGDASAASATMRQLLASMGGTVDERWRLFQTWMVTNEGAVAYVSGSQTFLSLATLLVAMADSTGSMPARVSSRVVYDRALRHVDPLQVYRVAQQTFELIRSMPPSTRDAVAGPAAAMMQDVGEWSTADHAPSAGIELAIQAGALWQNPAALLHQLPDALSRLARIGTKATTLPITQWINTANNAPVSMADQVTVVAFSSVTCRACEYAYQPMDSMYRRLRSRGFQMVLSVPTSEGGRDPAAGWRNILTPFKVSFPVALTQITDLSAVYPLHAWPAFVVIDRHGIVRDLWEGWNGGEDLEQRVERILSEPVSSRAGAE